MYKPLENLDMKKGKQKNKRKTKSLSQDVNFNFSEFSIEKILERRESQEAVLDLNIEEIRSATKAIIKESKKLSRDSSVFHLKSQNFPRNIEEIIKLDGDYNINNVNELSKFERTIVENNIYCVALSEYFLYKLVKTMLIEENVKYEHALMDYINRFQPETLEFGSIFGLISYAILNNCCITNILVSIVNTKLFKDYDVIEMYFLYFSSLVSFSDHFPLFFQKLISNFGELLKSTKLEKANKQYIINNSVKILEGESLSYVSNFLSFFPLCGMGKDLFFEICMKLSVHILLKDDEIFKYDIEKIKSEFIKNIGQIIQLCQSEEDEDLTSASVLMETTIRVTTIGVNIKSFNVEDIKSILNSCKYNINTRNLDPTTLMNIKEQLLFLRVLMEMHIDTLTSDEVKFY